MTESTELVAAEQPQQLITIEPTKYVELVFEPFAKQYADAVDAVREVAYDIKTTAGMAVAIKHRAVFRDIRVASEKARKLRKAPILEIGKLLDSRQGEIESTLLPLETLFDEEIKAEEGRKESEKQAKLAAEQQRIAAIRARIDVMRNAPARYIGAPSSDICLAADAMSEAVISLEEWQEFSGEAQVERDHAVKKLREMQAAQFAIEQAAIEAARQAEVDRLERERVAEANRLEAKRLEDLAAEIETQAQLARDRQALADTQAREQREAAEAEQRAANERAAAAMRAEQEAHQSRMRAQQEEIDRQQAAIDAERQRQADEAARVEREKQDAIAAEAERVAAEERRQQELAVAAERAEATKAAEALQAAEAERERRERVQFEQNGPEPTEIIAVLADHYNVSPAVVRHWLGLRFWAQEEKAA
ncbi:coiled-coil domain-containing protein [Paraburkholderia sediminicola]|uniref:hypothetical protein n=1 Tax=Paraburkholderia sediminicola TaxID=458836 RepID=UPI0038BE0823